MFEMFFKKNLTDLDGQEFKNQLLADENAVLLDVRTAGEFQSGTILSAKNIDVMASDFNTKLSKLDKSKTYFVFCRSGNRSGNAVNMMKKEGFNAFNLVGGIGAFPKN
ncbi:rhodanese-like domain-containing protein [Pedobacter cryophilus]|uniref:Rhodanese-like domain-containing protein n=1 Tax=Pedobacter cryophilus TaxID=2571271 RepID=A0A4U1C0S3_9SPHI|nr:rhodanese-like domain-containing protein [Pedobacter cryophilus]TKB97670.1 rhodanese-like domain-containing protein [Pedobacter cryophilus]